MAKFEVDFQVKGVGDITLPVTILDEAVLMIEGLEAKSFRFSVENILDRALSLVLSVDKVGSAADKVDVDLDLSLLDLDAGEVATVTATVTPAVALFDGDLVAVKVVGVELEA